MILGMFLIKMRLRLEGHVSRGLSYNKKLNLGAYVLRYISNREEDTIIKAMILDTPHIEKN